MITDAGAGRARRPGRGRAQPRASWSPTPTSPGSAPAWSPPATSASRPRRADGKMVIDEGIDGATTVERGDDLVTAGARGSRLPARHPRRQRAVGRPHQRPHRADPRDRAVGRPRGVKLRGRPALRRGLPVSARGPHRERPGGPAGGAGGLGRAAPADLPGVAGGDRRRRGATSCCSSPSPRPWRPTPSGGPSAASPSAWPSTCSSTPPSACQRPHPAAGRLRGGLGQGPGPALVAASSAWRWSRWPRLGGTLLYAGAAVLLGVTVDPR